jgi:hypothetical protein
MAVDLFGVTLSGRIIQFPKGPGSKSRVVDLWVGDQDNEEGRESEFPALAFVSQVNIEILLGDNAKLQVVLTPPFEEGLQLLQSDLVRFGTGRLEVEIGYSTGTPEGGASQFRTLPFFGLLQKPDVSIGADVTITLNALGVGYALTTVGGSKGKSYPSSYSPARVVQEVFRKYVDGKFSGLDISDLYDNVPTELQGTDPFFQKVIDHTREAFPKTKNVAEKAQRVMQGPRNDWWFIKEVIENYGFDLFIQGNKVYVVKKTDWLNRKTGFGEKSAPRKHFMLKGNVDPNINLFPILSFQTPTSGVWLENGIGCQVASDLKEDKSGTSTACASAKTTTITQVKEQGGVDPDSPGYTAEAGETSKNVPVNPNSPEGREKVAGQWRNSMMTGGIQGEISTIGVPGLRPGEVVDVSGFEYRLQPSNQKVLFNGTYGIINVRHSIGVGGFTTNFLGVMDFFPTAFKEGLAKTKGELVEAEEIKAVPDLAKGAKTTKTPKKGKPNAGGKKKGRKDNFR